MSALAAHARVSAASATAEPDWEGIVETIHTAVGRVPVYLAGSRATGSWDAASDYDLVVVLPLARIPRAVGLLAGARDQLEQTLGAQVSLNPLPAFQLRRGATNLYVWKLHKEGMVLFAPEGFPAERPAPFQLTATSAWSYLMTAVFVLLDAAGTPEPVNSWPGDVVTRGIKKALLHIVQLRLLRSGDYATTLEEALELSHDPGVAALLSESSNPGAWFAIRGLLLSELAAVSPRAGISRAIVRNAQYASLSRLRGSNRLSAVMRTTPIEYVLSDAALRLLQAVGKDGSVDAASLRDVAGSLPRELRVPRDDWRALRDALRQEWASAHALAGL